MGRSSYTSSTVSFLVQEARSSPWYKATHSSSAWYDDPSNYKANGSTANDPAANAPAVASTSRLPAAASSSSSNARANKDAPTLWAHKRFDPDDEALPSIEERFLDPHEVVARITSGGRPINPTTIIPPPQPPHAATRATIDPARSRNTPSSSESTPATNDPALYEVNGSGAEIEHVDQDNDDSPINASRRMLVRRAAQQWEAWGRPSETDSDEPDSESDYEQAVVEEDGDADADASGHSDVATRRRSRRAYSVEEQAEEDFRRFDAAPTEANTTQGGADLDSETIVEFASAFLRHPRLAEHASESEYGDLTYLQERAPFFEEGNDGDDDVADEFIYTDFRIRERIAEVDQLWEDMNEEERERAEYRRQYDYDYDNHNNTNTIDRDNDDDDIVGGPEAFFTEDALAIGDQVIDRRSTPSIADDFSPSAGVFHTHTLPFNLPNMGEMQMQRRASDRVTSSSLGHF